jgi:hypothetical protein
VVRNALRAHGAVCLKNTHFKEAELIRLGSILGDELVILPPELCFNNKDPRY